MLFNVIFALHEACQFSRKSIWLVLVRRKNVIFLSDVVCCLSDSYRDMRGISNNHIVFHQYVAFFASVFNKFIIYYCHFFITLSLLQQLHNSAHTHKLTHTIENVHKIPCSRNVCRFLWCNKCGSFWFEKFLFTKLFFAELNMEQKRKKNLRFIVNRLSLNTNSSSKSLIFIDLIIYFFFPLYR